MAFWRIISASQGARVTVQKVLSADTAMLPQAVNCPSYLFSLESHRSHRLFYRCGVRRSTVVHELPQMYSASGLYTH